MGSLLDVVYTCGWIIQLYGKIGCFVRSHNAWIKKILTFILQDTQRGKHFKTKVISFNDEYFFAMNE